MIAMINDLSLVFLLSKKTLFTLWSVSLPLGEEKAVSSRLLVPTRIANLTRITDKMPTTKNSVVLVVDCNYDLC